MRALAFAALSLLAAGPALAADPPGITLEAPGVAPQLLSEQDIGALPAADVTLNLGGHDAKPAAFHGPLLWTVLIDSGAADAAHPRTHVHQTITATGRDGYTAVLALGEIDPEFEGKQVIIATTMNGQDLGAEHLRLVVPNDHRGGRSVRDLARLAVSP